MTTDSLAVPLAVQPQVTGFGGDRPEEHKYRSADRNHCPALSEKYGRYVGRSEDGPDNKTKPDIVGGVALANV